MFLKCPKNIPWEKTSQYLKKLNSCIKCNEYNPTKNPTMVE